MVEATRLNVRLPAGRSLLKPHISRLQPVVATALPFTTSNDMVGPWPSAPGITALPFTLITFHFPDRPPRSMVRVLQLVVNISAHSAIPIVMLFFIFFLDFMCSLLCVLYIDNATPQKVESWHEKREATEAASPYI